MAVVQFRGAELKLDGGPRLVHRQQRQPIERAAERGVIEALILDARTAEDGEACLDMLRALYDNPRRPRRPLHPRRVIGLIPDGDVGLAFALGRYGIEGLVEASQLGALPARLERMMAREVSPEPLAQPSPHAIVPPAIPQRAALVAARPPDELPTVAVGYRHPPETRVALQRYIETLREQGHETSVYADVATLMETMLAEGLTCQTELATKAGVTHTGQYIGSFSFYEELRRTRYANIADHPSGAIAMDVFIAVDEVLHEVLHLLFLANRLRGGMTPEHPYLAEEMSVGWWQGMIHHRVFPEWIDRQILFINDDFVLCEEKQDKWEFWHVGHVFDQYAHYPWMLYVIAQLPERDAYIGQRADMDGFLATLARRDEASFLHRRLDELRIDTPFRDYPGVPMSFAMR